jgi:histone deacetylase 6
LIDTVPLAERSDIELAHCSEHVEKVFNASKNQDGEILAPGETLRQFVYDNYENKHTSTAVQLSVGATIKATEISLQGEADASFALVRPPGHHSCEDKALGFCFFNNAAVAARTMQKRHGVKKVAIFDWDVHFGDGTADIFKNDDSVLYCSIHRFDNGAFYPGSVGRDDHIGEGKGAGHNISFPFDLVKGDSELVGDREYIYACEKVFFPIIREFEPEILIISAGFDSAIGDPLG